METSLEEKHSFVQQWLKKIFDGTSVPEYSSTDSRVLDSLYDMAQRSEEQSRQLAILTSDMERKIAEYNSETERMRAVHEDVGITLANLPTQVRENIELLAEITVVLETKDSSPHSHSLALSELLRTEATLTAEVGEATEYLAQLQEDIRTITIDNAHLSRTLRELDKEAKAGASSLSKKKRDSAFLQQKSEQYKKQIATLEADLARNGYTPEIQHPVLLQRYKELQSLQNELGAINKQLDSYADLPPNLDLARVKVEEAKQELARLEAELSQNIDLIHAEN